MQHIGFEGTDMQYDIIRDKLLVVVNEYNITLDTLHKVTGIDVGWLSEYISKKRPLSDLPMEQYGLFFETVVILSDGMKLVSDDERIKGVIDVLVQVFGLKYDTLSLYTGLDEQDIELFMRDPAMIDFEKKYKLATKSLILHYIFKNKNTITAPLSS
ncbi:MAG: HTH domain-containing protein [Bacilli bacterium]